MDSSVDISNILQLDHHDINQYRNATYSTDDGVTETDTMAKSTFSEIYGVY